MEAGKQRVEKNVKNKFSRSYLQEYTRMKRPNNKIGWMEYLPVAM